MYSVDFQNYNTIFDKDVVLCCFRVVGRRWPVEGTLKMMDLEARGIYRRRIVRRIITKFE